MRRPALPSFRRSWSALGCGTQFADVNAAVAVQVEPFEQHLKSLRQFFAAELAVLILVEAHQLGRLWRKARSGRLGETTGASVKATGRWGTSAAEPASARAAATAKSTSRGTATSRAPGTRRATRAPGTRRATSAPGTRRATSAPGTRRASAPGTRRASAPQHAHQGARSGLVRSQFAVLIAIQLFE
jgi:hypothetical protein